MQFPANDWAAHAQGDVADVLAALTTARAGGFRAGLEEGAKIAEDWARDDMPPDLEAVLIELARTLRRRAQEPE